MASNDDASLDEAPQSSAAHIAANPTPRVSDIPLPLAKKFGVLGDLRVVIPSISNYPPSLQIPLSDTPDSALAPSISKLNKDYADVMKKVKEQRRLPHERDTSPRRTRISSAGSSRRDIGYTQTPTHHIAEGRFTDDGSYVTQPQSALLEPVRGISEAEGDSDFNANEADVDPAAAVITGRKKGGRIRVVVRKRPLRDGELGEDCVEVCSPTVHIGAIKQRIDLSEYTEKHDYEFDDSFGEHDSNDVVYQSCGRALIDTVFDGGSASCFAYGQTGSGKTHTMIGNEREPGMYIMAATDIFDRLQPEHHVFVSLYEIYCNSLFDLLNYRTVVVAREDANKRVNICGLTWHEIVSTDDLRGIIERGTVQRRTGSTSANEFSSRSHAVMTITLRDESRQKFCGSLNIVDLAGSERAADVAATDKQTRLEGAEINKSLLALKECIRGLDERKRHIPFRGSKLTEVLRDSFVGNSCTVMVATISPSSENVEHTLNTLRYAFRVKGLTIAPMDPSRDRNVPRPAPMPRSKSVDPQIAVPPSTSAVPLLPPIREKRKKKSRDKKRHGSNSSTPRVDPEAFLALESGLKSEIQGLREDMVKMASDKDQHIHLLVEQNRRLEKELRRMQKFFLNAQKVEFNDDVDSVEAADGGRSPELLTEEAL
jgi:kinesin family protein 2/24